MARGLIRDGNSPVVAMVVSLFATAIGAIHFLIRPHLFTFAFVYLTLRACQKQHQRGGWSVAAVPFYTAILANLHGGFVALPVIVATAALGHAISGAWDHARRRNVAKFGLTILACGIAGLANPYGIGLYRHVIHLLVSSGVTSLIIEYQPAPFGKPDAEVLEWVLLALVGLPVVSTRRIDRYHMTHLLVWLHLALTSIRNAPLFALAAAPALATLLDGLPLAMRKSWKRDDRTLIWPLTAALGVLLLLVGGVNLGGFNREKWPFVALGTLNHQSTAARLFHEQDWGGLIAAECQPARRTYLDDRFEIYGKEADSRIRRRAVGRPGLGYCPRSRQDRDGLVASRSRAGQEAAQGTGLGGSLSRQDLDFVPAGAGEQAHGCASCLMRPRRVNWN